MYSEQLAVLIFIAATQIAGQGHHPQPTVQVPSGSSEQIGFNLKLTSAERQRINAIKRQRHTLLVAQNP
jgi:hypothetical protein